MASQTTAATVPQPGPDPAQDQNEGTNPASQGAYIRDIDAPVPLNKLQPKRERIDCPVCKKTTQTRIEKKGVGAQGLLGFCCWPLPNRKHWFEWTHWYCTECGEHIAKQKWGKPLIVLAPGHVKK